VGKSPENARLVIVTSPEFLSKHAAEFDDLQAKGHTILLTSFLTMDFDMILEPRAWRTWTDSNGKIAHLAMAIKAARVAKKLREKKK